MVDDRDKKYDVCIVGTGPGGAFVANQLSARGYRIAIIESGDKDVNYDPAKVIDFENSSFGGNVNFGINQQLGGASNLWAGGVVPMNRIDFEERRDLDLPGWPISLTVLDHYYSLVDDYFGIRKAPKPGDLSVAPDQAEARETVLLPQPFVTTGLLTNKPGITIYTRSEATRIIISNAQRSVEGVEFFDRESKKNKAITAKIVILAGGGIGSIRLLLHSFVNLSQFKQLYNNTGRYFSTHPKVDIGWFLPAQPLSKENIYSNYFDINGYGVRYQFGLQSDILKKHGLLNHCLRFDLRGQRLLNRLFDKVSQQLTSISFFKSGNSKLARIFSTLGIQVYRRIERVSGEGKRLAVRIFLDQSPMPDCCVTLSDKLSDSGLPLARIHWNYSDTDFANMQKFIRVFSDALKESGQGVLEIKPNLENELTSVHSHFMGGTRMGLDPNSSVVNENLQVHGIANLYISSPSVFPTFGYANPFYTIAALSLRLADYIFSKGRLK